MVRYLKGELNDPLFLLFSAGFQQKNLGPFTLLSGNIRTRKAHLASTGTVLRRMNGDFDETNSSTAKNHAANDCQIKLKLRRAQHHENKRTSRHDKKTGRARNKPEPNQNPPNQ